MTKSPIGPNVNTTIKIRDAQWWLGQSVPTLTSTVPTDLYYQPDQPLGKLFFWPVPTIAYDVQLMVRVVLDSGVVLADTFDFPPGYQQALTLTLAELSARSFGKPVDSSLRWDASQARALIFGVNDQIPHLITKDSGMTSGHSGTRADFNYLDGSVV